jgi:hypothetical protein
MLLYSKTVISFIKRCEKLVREILKEETDAVPRRTRFLYKGYLYPINVVVFEKKNIFGYFDPDAFQIGIHKSLMYQAKNPVLKDLIRHELAHYFCFIDHGHTEQIHGPEFKRVCERYGWDRSISKASMNLYDSNESIEGDLNSEKVIEKVKKLLKLAASSNSHEAELATLKANQLLLKHNLSYIDSIEMDETLFVHKLKVQKRKDAKLQCIYDILRLFLVRPVFNYGQGKVYLEVTGTKTNVSLAQYICDFLDHELDRLWDKASGANAQLRGIKSRNSFFAGVSAGYKSKIESSIQSYSPQEKNALIMIEQDLNQKIRSIYRSLSSSSFSTGSDSFSKELGHEAGRRLTINKGVESTSTPRSLTLL